MDILPGNIRQNGYVVGDLDVAMTSWCALGVGPWFTIRNRPQRLRFRGEPSEPTLSIAMANSGSLQIELIQQHDNAPSAYREFIDAGREGFHHHAWWTDDVSSAIARAHAARWRLLQDGGGGGDGTPFAYFETGGAASSIVELSQLNDSTRWMNAKVADAAADWDRVTDPVRPLM